VSNSHNTGYAVNSILQPPKQSAANKLSTDDFAKSFINKATNSHASVYPLLQQQHQSCKESAATDWIYTDNCLWDNQTAKSCLLNPIPTWLLMRILTTLSLILCHLCNFFPSAWYFPTQLKQAQVISHPVQSFSHIDAVGHTCVFELACVWNI